jgi:hypothetical protein
MSLSEIMHNADLSLYPKIGLVIFLGIFVLVCGRTLRMRRLDLDRLARLALEEDATTPATTNGSAR